MSITIEDLRNPKRKSGFDYVRAVKPSPNGHPGKLMFSSLRQGQKNSGGGAVYGKNYDTAEEAAQDYVDHVTATGIVPKKLALKSAGHSGRRKRLHVDEEVQAALGVLRDAKGHREGKQGYVYCISDGEYVKVGYSTNPEARVPELQTGNARTLTLLGAIPGTVSDEKALHIKYIKNNVLQEWFEPVSDLLAEFDVGPKRKV